MIEQGLLAGPERTQGGFFQSIAGYFRENWRDPKVIAAASGATALAAVLTLEVAPTVQALFRLPREQIITFGFVGAGMAFGLGVAVVMAYKEFFKSQQK